MKSEVSNVRWRRATAVYHAISFTILAAMALISITNLRVHVLVHGSRYDLDFRRPL